MSDFEEKDINEIPKEEIPKTADTPVDDFAMDYVIEDESEEAPKEDVLKDEPKKKKGGKTLLILLLVFLLSSTNIKESLYCDIEDSSSFSVLFSFI